MAIVGDPDRDRAISLLRRAYVDGRLSAEELEGRVDRAVRARTLPELCSSVRGVPGAALDLSVSACARPLADRGRLAARQFAARLVKWLVLIVWGIATLALAVGSITAFAVAAPTAVLVLLGLTWAGISLPAGLTLRWTRRASSAR